ncbi:hypothetical protein BYT27DRAFT_7156633 [Phlegmacium glaucopus]|nr:hypothetical protein BYT27DRAFT_7156633 [Phlegmacium glaucopus]
MSATLDSSLPLDNSMGAMLLGVVISAVLHGVVLLQAFIYFMKYKKDTLFLKTLVGITVLFDNIHLAFITHTVYYYLISNFHSPQRLELLTWSVIMEALFTGVNGAIVQTFYTYRVWCLKKKSYFLTALILLLILATVGCGTVWVILSMQIPTYEKLLHISPLTITINALSTTVDVIIATTLCVLLNQARTGFKKSDTIINKLIIFVVNTGVLTTCCAMASLISLILSPNSLIYASFYFCIGRFYTNSFLATLNARRSIKDSVDDTSYMMMSIPTNGLSHSTNHQTSKQQPSIAIRIDTTTEGEAYSVAEKQDPTMDNKRGSY